MYIYHYIYTAGLTGVVCTLQTAYCTESAALIATHMRSSLACSWNITVSSTNEYQCAWRLSNFSKYLHNLLDSHKGSCTYLWRTFVTCLVCKLEVDPTCTLKVLDLFHKNRAYHIRNLVMIHKAFEGGT